MTTTDRVIPDGKWRFDGAVTDVFDDMLSRSIPAYATMREACNRLARGVVAREGAVVVDLGCSRGGAIADLMAHASPSTRVIGVEASEPMHRAAAERFSADPRVTIRRDDVVELRLPAAGADLILSVLTVMFTPIEHRLRILAGIHEALRPGGMLLFVEKVIGANARADAMLVDAYLQMKREHGYSEEEIQRKRLSLEGVLVPMTARWNEELLGLSGFGTVDCFWRFLNFSGWVAIK